MLVAVAFNVSPSRNSDKRTGAADIGISPQCFEQWSMPRELPSAVRDTAHRAASKLIPLQRGHGGATSADIGFVNRFTSAARASPSQATHLLERLEASYCVINALPCSFQRLADRPQSVFVRHGKN